jgi:catechol 2,3-dioxygenase-like lactoylglutathione lyase family enzyme
MQLRVDHVTMCGSDLDAMRRACTTVGLPSEYGGPHANRATHMALVGFEDGSYLELIAPFAPEAAATGMMGDWAKYMRENAGPSAWAVASSDIHAEVQRLRTAGIPVRGPDPGGRTRADGTDLQWETAILGAGSAGSLLPFMIQDKTSRSLRVQPSAALEGSGITGVGAVVLGVRDLEEAAAQFRRAYGWSEPAREENPEFGASLAHFPGTPVTLAAAVAGRASRPHVGRQDAGATPGARLDRFGECPAAFLLSTPNVASAVQRFRLQPASAWFGRRLAWFDSTRLGSMRLGVIESATAASMP